MSNDNEEIPDELAPVGGWNNNPVAPQTVAAPVAPPAAPTLAPVPSIPAGNAPGSRFAMPAPPLPPAPTGAKLAPPAPAPAAALLAPPPPAPERPYTLAGAYRRGLTEPVSSSKIVAAIVAGSIVAAVMTTFWMFLFLFVPHWSLALLGGGMGYLVGFTVFKITGEGEEKSCWISCIISTLFALGGALTILVAFPSIWTLFVGCGVVYFAYDKGYHTPEVMAVETAA